MSFVTDLIGASMQADATESAADAQRQATEAGINEQRRQFDLTRQDYQPYRDVGYSSLSQLQRDINAPTTAADVMSDPGYQFGLQQGQQALDRKAAAMGGRVSGAALKAATRFGTDYASTGYGAAYQRRQDRLNRLAALAGIGQTATGASAAAGGQATNAITDLLSGQGNANAAAGMARSNIWGNAGSRLGASLDRAGYGMNSISKLFDSGSTFSTPSGMEGMNPDELGAFFGG